MKIEFSKGFPKKYIKNVSMVCFNGIQKNPSIDHDFLEVWLLEMFRKVSFFKGFIKRKTNCTLIFK